MRAIAVKQRIVMVSDRMQQGYRYVLVAPIGRNFDPDFRPELSPSEMLRSGVFGGKYMTDCRDEFPHQNAQIAAKERTKNPPHARMVDAKLVVTTSSNNCEFLAYLFLHL